MRWTDKKHKWVIVKDACIATLSISSGNDSVWRDEVCVYRTRKLARLECPNGARVIKVLISYNEVVTES